VGGITDAPDVTFVTAAAVSAPTVSTRAPTAITRYGVRLHGTVTAKGSPTSYHFDIGPTTGSDESEPTPDASAGSGSTPPSAADTMFEGLRPGTTYHCRTAATNSAGTACGDDVAPATEAPLPSGTVLHASPTVPL
jgi:hypothetical protein